MLKISTRFSVGVHILALLEICKDFSCTSEFIAGSVNTNPVVIRRLLAMLKKAGLVQISRGIAGAKLAKQPKDISLLEIYYAVGAVDSTLFSVHENTNPQCPVGANIQSALDDTIHSAQSVMERELAKRNLADIVENIKRKMG